ncbi:HD domain-containing protein [Sorangium sp. So ce887]|uniref:HD domain-containing protein n=1 Tax=Sorangium sp. So ce887 TaxID=3133324 RepID=UPI003F605F51
MPALRTPNGYGERDIAMGILLKRALDQAAVWHRAQKRKYPNADVPYISHLAGVAVLLARHGFDDEVVAAGALHDAMEDQGVTFDELVQHFGERVATLVRHVTEQDRSLPWEDRKRLYLKAFPGKPWEAQAITLADKIDNLQSIIVCSREHGDPWPMFKRGREVQVARFEELRAMGRALAPHPLVDEYEAVLDELLSTS